MERRNRSDICLHTCTPSKRPRTPPPEADFRPNRAEYALFLDETSMNAELTRMASSESSWSSRSCR